MEVLLTYIIAAVFFTIIGIVASRFPRSPRSYNMHVNGRYIVIYTFIINILYTYILGGNMKPASTLELVLDIVTGVIMIIGFFMLIQAKRSNYNQQS